MDRRKARERAKGIRGDSPSEANSPAADGKEAGEGTSTAPTGKKGRAKKNTEGTARKCANCGQVGHIKTNKKSAPSFICHDCTTQTNGEDGGGSNRRRRSQKKAATATTASPPSSTSTWLSSTSMPNFL